MKKIKKVADILRMMAGDQGLTRLSYRRISLAIGNAQNVVWGELRKRYERTQEIADDIRPFIEIAAATTTGSDGRYALPSDYGAFSAAYIGLAEQELDICKEGEVAERLISTLIPVSSDRPFGVFRGSYLQIYPKQAYSSIQFVYLKKPSDPSIGFSVVSNREVYVDATTVDLEVADSSIDEIIVRAAKELGIALNNQMLTQYTGLGLQLEQRQSR